MIRAITSSRLPAAEQEALLRAAFLPVTEALESWKTLTRFTVVEDFQASSHCLLPLVYANLREDEGADTGIQKLKGTSRYTWSGNSSSIQAIAGLLRAFIDEGIEVLVRRDVALALRYYTKPGLRAIHGVHLLVRAGAAASAIDLLERCGWSSLVHSPRVLLRSGVLAAFRDPSGRRVLLSWRMLRPEIDDDPVWASSEGIVVGEEPTRVVGATDALLESCRVGAEWDIRSPAQRMADAAAVLRSAGDQVDWDRLTSQANQSATVLGVHNTLHYVSRVLRVPVQADALDRLACISPSTLDRLEYQAIPGSTVPLNACRIHWLRYRRLGRDPGPLGFPRYLQQIWGYQELWQAAMHAGHAIIREVQREVSHVRAHRA